MSRKALLLGINTLGLRFADQDARRLGEALQGFGYETNHLPNSNAKIIESLDETQDIIAKTDTLIFYYSGHGILDKGQLKLVLNDDTKKAKNLLSINRIIDFLDDCRAANKLLILDCCHAGAVHQEWSPDYTDAYRILTASDRLDKSKELEELAGGFLTTHLCRALTTKAPGLAARDTGELRVSALYQYLRRAAEEQNGRPDATKVPIPNLSGNEKHNFSVGNVKPAAESQVTEQFTLYLAEVSDDLGERRDEVKRYLEQLSRHRQRLGQIGIRILPDMDKMPPQVFSSPDELQETLDRQLDESKLFIQLLSRWAPIRPEVMHNNINQWSSATRKELEIFQWCERDEIMQAKDPGQQQLLSELTVKAGPINDFKDALRQRLSESPIFPASSPPPAGDAEEQLLFLYAAPEDQELVDRADNLLRKLDIGFMRLTEGDEQKRRAKVEAYLQHCDALLMLHGKCDNDWVDYGLLACRKIIANRVDRKRVPIALCQIPPPEKSTPAVHIPGLQVMRMLPDRLEEGLRQCLEQLTIHINLAVEKGA